MKIFLSHSSRQKPLIREIRRYFPEHVDTWIDERNLFIGDDVTKSLETEVSEKSDYLLLFLDRDAARSEWVRKEIRWALEAERQTNRTLLLVVLIDHDALDELGVPALSERRYLKCSDFSERAIEFTANSIVADLFALACRELETINNPSAETQVDLLRSADDFLEVMAQKCISLLFPFRQENPISKDDFFEMFQKSSNEEIARVTLAEILDELFEKDMMPGVAYDGHEIFIQEEHYRWKTQINSERKAAVARIAARSVRSGDTIAIDAGSATDELVKVLCARFVSRSLANITIVTNSMSAVEMLLDTADIHGLDEHSCPFKLFLVGGYVRPNTRALVNLDDEESGSFLKTIRKLGGADLGFIGVNGIDRFSGMTTHENIEVKNKKDIISLSKKSIILGDSTKVGIVEDQSFASFEDEVTVVVDQTPETKDLYDSLSGCSAEIILA